MHPSSGLASPPVHAGISTLEALVVAAVTCTLVGAAASQWSGIRARLAVRAAATTFATDVHQARMMAVARQETVRLSFADAADGSCWVVHSGPRTACRCLPGGHGVCTGDAEVLAVAHWPIGQPVRIEANVRSMAFDPVGGTVSPTGSVRFTARGAAGVQQVVGILGRVRSCSPGGATPGMPAC